MSMSRLIFVPATAAPADAGAGIAAQTTRALALVDERLRAARSSLADAVVLTVYLRRAADFPAMNDAYRQVWGGLPATRTTVVTELMTDGAQVEIAAVGVPAGTERRLVHPASWMASPNPYSYGLRTGEMLFLSGLIARNGKDNTAVQGDVAAQTRVVMENASELLGAAGLSVAHLVSARAFLTDLKDFAEFNRVYREFVGGNPPARATVGASLTGPAYNVEVTFVASAAAREAIEIATPNPNLSAAVKTGPSLFVSGLLADGDAADPAGQTRDILRKLQALLDKAGCSRADVRDLLVYVTDADAGRAALAVCRESFGGHVPASAVRAGLADPAARVEIMAYAERE